MHKKEVTRAHTKIETTNSQRKNPRPRNKSYNSIHIPYKTKDPYKFHTRIHSIKASFHTNLYQVPYKSRQNGIHTFSKNKTRLPYQTIIEILNRNPYLYFSAPPSSSSSSSSSSSCSSPSPLFYPFCSLSPKTKRYFGFDLILIYGFYFPLFTHWSLIFMLFVLQVFILRFGPSILSNFYSIFLKFHNCI